MSYPVPWHNSLGYGLTFGQLPDPAWSMAFDGVDYPPDYLPEEKCEGGRPPCMDNWMYEAGVNEAFTNYTFIPGEPTLGGYSTWPNFKSRKIIQVKKSGQSTFRQGH